MGEPRNALMSGYGMGGYDPRQVPRSDVLAERASILPIGIDIYGRAQWAVPNVLMAPYQAFWRAGDAAARGDWQGAGYAGAEAAGAAMVGGLGMPRPSGSIGMAGNPIPISSWHGPRAAALRQQQMQEALALMRQHPEKFMSGEGALLVDQLENAAGRMQFGPSVKPAPDGPGSVIPMRR